MMETRLEKLSIAWQAVVGALLLGTGLAVLGTLAWMEVPSLAALFRPPALQRLLRALAILLPLAAFGVWSWAFLRSRALRRPDGHLVFRHGMVGWGLMFGLTMAGVTACDAVGGCTTAGILSRTFLFELLMSGLICVTISLWAGYLFGIVLVGVLRKMMS